MNNVPLYSKAKTGKTVEWVAFSDLTPNSDAVVTITIQWFQHPTEANIKKGVTPKVQTKLLEVKSGKNVGKSNETSIEEQAVLELKYLYQKQFDKGYVTDLKDYREPITPMLAHKYSEYSSKILWGVKEYFVSRKLDGIRCFIHIDENGVPTRYESRSGKDFKIFPHISKDLQSGKFNGFKNCILDGELFNKKIPFNVISTLVNSSEYVTSKNFSTEDIEFHLYDVVLLDDLQATYKDRLLNRKGLESYGSIAIVENTQVTSEAEMIDLSRVFIEEGYEGSMVRAGDAPYEFGRRSYSLMKYKEFVSEEFKVLDIYLAENDKTKIMMTLANHHNPLDEAKKTFECSVKGDKGEVMEYLTNKKLYLNKWVTTSYQCLSSYKVPLFAQAESFREGEVVNGQFIPSV